MLLGQGAAQTVLASQGRVRAEGPLDADPGRRVALLPRGPGVSEWVPRPGRQGRVRLSPRVHCGPARPRSPRGWGSGA